MKSLLFAFTLLATLALANAHSHAGNSTLDLSAEKRAAQERLQETRQRAKESQVRCIDDAIQQIEKALAKRGKKARKSAISSHAKNECRKLWGKMWALD